MLHKMAMKLEQLLLVIYTLSARHLKPSAALSVALSSDLELLFCHVTETRECER